jgi:hypothetical protein
MTRFKSTESEPRSTTALYRWIPSKLEAEAVICQAPKANRSASSDRYAGGDESIFQAQILKKVSEAPIAKSAHHRAPLPLRNVFPVRYGGS